MFTNIGRTIYGFCNGYFGRDDYDDKIILFEGLTWIVCRYVNNETVVALNFDTPEEKEKCLANWTQEERYENSCD